MFSGTVISKASFVCLAFALAASAQTYEISGFGSFDKLGRAPLGSIAVTNPKENDSELRNGFGYGARLTWNTKGYYGFELGYSRNQATFRTKIRPSTTSESLSKGDAIMQEGSVNAICYFMPSGERLRPFITGGADVQLWGAPKIPEWTAGGNRDYGVNFGGGLKYKLFEHASMRLDLRDHIGGAPYRNGMTTAPTARKRLQRIEASLGFGITF